jgi:hypothetical protein
MKCKKKRNLLFNCSCILFSNRTTIIQNKDELVECLTTGRFDAKNKRVRGNFQSYLVKYD